MSPQDIRETLILKTIEVMANEGLDKTTTKAITKGTGINEVYIYRHFSNKEGLQAKVFEALDEELMAAVDENIEIMYMAEMAFDVRCRFYFDKIWKFLLSNREKCLAFIRYYYSPHYSKYSAKEHKIRYKPIVEKFSSAFKEESDVWMILNHILHVMLAFAVMVHDEQMPNEDIYSEHVFRVIYASVEQYFKNT
ncbi:MAG: TetR/AcrR family transcriptional regulator [Ruminococcaceae bacterium]|nr:TetR/AcrR family transcriptional regulator [Oscillospiraceae bacterium]